MRPTNKAWLATLALLPVGLGIGAAANAETLNLTDTITYPGPTPPGVTVANTALTHDPITPNATFALSHGLGANLSTIPNNFVNGNPSGTLSWNFYDDYVFSTTGATVDAAVISISIPQAGLGISNLQARIFTSAGNPAPTLGALSSGSTLVDAWTNATCGPTNCVITLPTDFAPGTYDLQIRGLAGSNGGSYGGSINFATTAVPLPAAVWFLLSGLAGFAGCARRKKLA